MLQKIVCAAMSQCIYHQPSILFLEDIDSITTVSSNNEENTPDSVNAARYFMSKFYYARHQSLIVFLKNFVLCFYGNVLGLLI